MKEKICVGGFLVAGNKFLFGKRSLEKKWSPGLWDIVGGKSLKNEHPLYTLRRETMEEIGVEVINAELIATLHVKEEDDKKPFTYMIYMITAYRGTPFNCSNEHSTIRWFSRRELGEKPLALREYLEIIDAWTQRN